MKILNSVCASACLVFATHTALAQAVNTTAIGQGSSATGENAVALGNGALASEANTVSLGNGGAVGGTGPAQRRLTQVGDGLGATDAINLRQLNGAIAGIDPRDQVARDAAATAQTTANTAVSDAARAQGTADTAQTTANTAQNTATAAQASALSAHQRITELDRKTSQGIAGALATAAAMPAGVDLEPGQTAMNIGVGAFDNQGALAFGLATRIKADKPLINGAIVRGAVAISGGRPGVSAGIGWKW